MEIQDTPSLQAAKVQVFKDLCRKTDFVFSSKLVKTKRAISIWPEFRVVLSKFNNRLSTCIHHVALKYEDLGKRLHFFKPKIDGTLLLGTDFYDKDELHLDLMPRKLTSTVFDQLCELSDSGCRIVLQTYEPKTKKKEMVVFIDAYEGSKLQIEADLKAPDFASLDWRETVQMPF